ncbi:hypothetical protein pdam_00019391 [Pocillopora damicornis]|uniref:Uncharacterized protein n=1 Tax=Pocillopora damicornis TaxID=46731 RepID=A0A3M6UFX2_POCDA|nr:hypothetical protein pdam_00019391 [Pocillopora damicornis]
MDLNGLSKCYFIILKDTMECLFWKNFSTASYGRESSLCGNKTLISDIRSYHVRLVLFLSISLASFPNFLLTRPMPPATRFSMTVCVTTNDENLTPGSKIKLDGM